MILVTYSSHSIRHSISHMMIVKSVYHYKNNNYYVIIDSYGWYNWWCNVDSRRSDEIDHTFAS